MKYRVSLNGKTYEVEVEAGKAMLLDEYESFAPVTAAPVAASAPAAAPAVAAAPAAVSLAAGEPVPAPMPGVILKLLVKQGDAVKEGDTLAILEAMKMENEIAAPKAGTVAQVVCKVGDKVDTGAALVVLA